MPDIQVRCTLKAANGVEADDCINTFSITGEPVVEMPALAGRFNAFYNELATGQLVSVAARINATIRRTNGLLVEFIENPQTPPNVPAYAAAYDLDPSIAGSLPNEVSVCLSMYTGDYLTTPTPGRSRGRVYIGPLNNNPLVVDAENVARVGANFMADLSLAAARLAFELGQDGVPLCVWSRAGNSFTVISGGWVDNEFDTQRRRGRERSSRVLWDVDG